MTSNEKLVSAIAALVIVGGIAWYTGFFSTAAMLQRAPEVAITKKKVRLINVLDKPTYDDAHIKGSEHIETNNVETVVRNWDKATPIVVYCSNYMCSSSREIAKKLTKLGFNNVKAYEGGTAEWYQLSQKDPSYRIEGPAKEAYLKQIRPASHEKPIGYSVITAAELKELLS